MMIGGWIPGKLTTIGARSGIGKTGMTAEFFASSTRIANGIRPEYLFFTWEMDSSYLVDRHICNRVGITNRELTQAAKIMGERTVAMVREEYDNARNLNVIYQQASTDINEVKRVSQKFIEICKIKEDEEQVKIQPVIVVDYLGMAKFENAGLRTYGIAEFVNGMKEFAGRTGSAVCLFAQINRSADSKDIPQRADFADSQSIEQSADNLLLLHRPEYNNIQEIYNPETGETMHSANKMLVRALKCRDFGTGDKVIGCDIKHFRFHDLSHEWGFKYWELYSDPEFWKSYFGLNKK